MPHTIRDDLPIVLAAPAAWDKLRGATVLVTGATGRIGRYLVEALRALNERRDAGVTVVALARSADKLRSCFGDEDDALRWLVQDVTSPIAWDGPVDYVFHTAGNAAPSDYVDHAVDTLWGHVGGMHNVLELARTHGTRRVLYVSTVEVYGRWEAPERIAEDDMGPLAHSSARACYPEAKRLCETMLACYEQQYGVDYVVVRMSHTFGPGIVLDDGRAFAEFIGCVLDGRDIMLMSDGSATRTYTYTADAVAGMFVALTRGDERIYNIVNEDSAISIRDLAQLVVSLRPRSGSKVTYAPGVVNPAVSYLPYPIGILDASRIRALGWEPQVPLADALERTISSFEREG